MPRPALPITAALAVTISLASCATPEASRLDTRPSEPPPSASGDGSLALPDYIPLAGNVELRGEPESIAITADDLHAAGWLSVATDGQSTFENGECMLTLRAEHRDSPHPAERDGENTELALADYFGSSDWIGSLPMTWPVNGRQSKLEAIVVVNTNEHGELRFTMARVIGDLGVAFLASLSCDAEVSTGHVFLDAVFPAIRVELR